MPLSNSMRQQPATHSTAQQIITYNKIEICQWIECRAHNKWSSNCFIRQLEEYKYDDMNILYQCNVYCVCVCVIEDKSKKRKERVMRLKYTDTHARAQTMTNICMYRIENNNKNHMIELDCNTISNLFIYWGIRSNPIRHWHDEFITPFHRFFLVLFFLFNLYTLTLDTRLDGATKYTLIH